MTPPGTSLVASASPRVTAGSGRASDARATTVLPETMIGASRDTRASSGASSGAMRPTTPVGSGTVKLKYGPATALAPPRTDGQLVGPPGVPDPAVDRGVDLAVGVVDAAGGQLVDELGPARPP